MFYRPPVLADSKLKRFRGPFAGPGVARIIPPVPAINLPIYSLPTLTSLEFWFNAQHGVTPDPSGVLVWEDQSSNGRDISRFSGNFQQVDGAINGQTVLDGDGAVFSFTAPPTSTTWTLFIVAQVDSDTFALGHTVNYQARIKFSNTEAMSFFNGVDRTSSTLPVATSNYAVYEWVINGTVLDMLQNGISVYSGVNNSVAVTWSYVGRTTTVTSCDMKVADIIGYSSILSASDRSTLRTTLTDRYNL